MHLRMFPTLLIDHDGWFDEPETDLNRKPVALSDDGWTDGADCLVSKRLSGGHAPGDLVLYRCGGELVPAALIEPAAEGCWLARDSRHGGKSFYLAERDIATRTRHRDFPLGEAA